MQSINLAPIITPLLELAATVVFAIGGWGITRLTTWLGLKNTDQINKNLESALQKAVTYGLQQTQTRIRAEGWDSLNVKNQALQSALPYMTERFQDTLRLAGVNTSDPDATKAAVLGALDRIFPAAAAAAAASPATPPETAPRPPLNQQLPPSSPGD